MAKANKKAALTLEERLEQALVPEAEQPYPVPENWCWTRFFIVLNYEQPANYIVESTEYKDDYSIPVLTAGKSFILGYTDETLGICSDLPVIIFDDFTTNSKFVNFPFKVKSSAMKILRPATEIKLCFIYYYMQTVNCDNSEHRRFWISTYSQLPFPIPPFAEQQRIVDRIESLFTKLDEAKEKAQAALDSFETRKASILHKAFTGELTAKWREENGVGMDSWKLETLAETCYSVFDGDHMPPPKAETGVPFLVISNVNNGHLSFENTRFVSQQYYDNLTATRKPQIYDVLYTLVGSYGIPVLVDTDKPFCFQRHMALLKPIPQKINSKLLWYQLKSDSFYQKATEISTGTAQLTVPIKGLRQLKLFIPTIDEQTQVVRLLDSFFAKEQKAKELCSVLDKIDLIKKSILARAFRGELGTNDPTEESALELLKSIV